jgi:hypothetical protein
MQMPRWVAARSLPPRRINPLIFVNIAERIPRSPYPTRRFACGWILLRLGKHPLRLAQQLNLSEGLFTKTAVSEAVTSNSVVAGRGRGVPVLTLLVNQKVEAGQLGVSFFVHRMTYLSTKSLKVKENLNLQARFGVILAHKRRAPAL